MKVTTIKSARPNASTVHLGEDIGWGSRPFCPALATGRREVDPHAEGTANCRPCIREANARYLDVDHLIQISSRVRNLIKAVREHAIANYNVGAWDIIVEAYTDPELAETVKTCRTAAGAIAKVAKVVELYRERRAPHDAEIAAATEPATTPEQPEQPEAVEYDRFAEGSHPDGSVVRWSHNAESGDSWARRTWPGKLGEGSIEWREFEVGSELTEVYRPGWRGVDIYSPGYCQHDAAPGEVCWAPTCNQPQCCPF